MGLHALFGGKHLLTQRRPLGKSEPWERYVGAVEVMLRIKESYVEKGKEGESCRGQATVISER